MAVIKKPFDPFKSRTSYTILEHVGRIGANKRRLILIVLDDFTLTLFLRFSKSTFFSKRHSINPNNKSWNNVLLLIDCFFVIARVASLCIYKTDGYLTNVNYKILMIKHKILLYIKHTLCFKLTDRTDSKNWAYLIKPILDRSGFSNSWQLLQTSPYM